MLEIKNLSIYLERDLRQLIKDFSLIVNKEEKVAFIGEEGNGKSTVLKSFVAIDELNTYATIQGEIIVKEEKIGYLPQQLSEKLQTMTLGEYFDTKLDVSNINYNKLAKLEKQFDLVDYSNNYNTIIGELSGGEKIKYLLFCELLKEPTVLLLDEPSNDLDITAKEWLKNFLKTSKLTVIFITHDRDLLEHCATKIVHFEQKMRKNVAEITIENSGYNDYLHARNKKIEAQNKRAEKERELYNQKLDRFRKIYNSVHDAQNDTVRSPLVARNLKDKMRTLKSQEKRLKKEKDNLTKKIEIEQNAVIKFQNNKRKIAPNILHLRLDNLCVGNKVLLDNVVFDFKARERTFILGENGSGKTTLLKTIMQFLTDNNYAYNYMPQNYAELLPDEENAYNYLKKFLNDDFTKIEIVLGSLRFTREEMLKNIVDLSGGQKAKVFLAKMMLVEKEILILDEPTRNLSLNTIEELLVALKNFQGTILCVTHDKYFYDNLATIGYEIKQKKLTLKLIN